MMFTHFSDWGLAPAPASAPATDTATATDTALAPDPASGPAPASSAPASSDHAPSPVPAKTLIVQWRIHVSKHLELRTNI